MSARLVVEATGPLCTVQDLGRPGLASLGVPESGALDPPALRLANRLVGNPEGAAGLEVTLGGLRARFTRAAVVAVTGAPVEVSVDGSSSGVGCAVAVPAGSVLALGSPAGGLRTYVGVRGGLEPQRLLGSASTDLLSGLGAPLAEGDEVPVGAEPGEPVPALDQAPLRTPGDEALTLRVVLGPREDWFTDEALHALTGEAWTVDARSNRVGLRLTGPELTRSRTEELPSEGTVAGSLQVPANGQPVLFLADHPVTGGYPVVGVVVTEDLPLAAQARPGQQVRLRTVRGPRLEES